MPKPTDHATWDSNSTNCAAPLSGHVTDGFANNEIPTAGEFNEWMRRVGVITDYVLAGDLELDGLTTAEVDLAMPNAAAVLVPATYATVIRLTGGGASAKIQGIQPDVDGRTLILINGTGSDITLSIQDGATLYQLWVADAAAGTQLRLAPNAAIGLRWNGIDGQWITLFSTARLTPNTWTWFPPPRCPVETNVSFGNSGGEYNSYVTATGAGVLSGIRLPLTVGDKLISIGAWFNDSGATGAQPHITLYRADFTQVGVPFTQIGNFFATPVPSGVNTFGKFTFNLTTPELVTEGYDYLLSIHLPNTEILGPIGLAKISPV